MFLTVSSRKQCCKPIPVVCNLLHLKALVYVIEAESLASTSVVYVKTRIMPFLIAHHCDRIICVEIRNTLFPIALKPSVCERVRETACKISNI